MKSLWLLLLLTTAFTTQAQLPETNLAKGIAAFKLKNYAAAFKYFDTEARKNRPDPNAFYYIGQCYENGLGKVKDPAEALTLYRMAAQTQPYSLPAIAELINIYRTGKNGLTKDPQRAFMWAKTLIQLDTGKKYMDIPYYLAEMYWKGIGTGKDLKEAARLMSEGKYNGSKLCVEGCRIMGLEMYPLGLEAYHKKDYTTAAMYYKIAATVSNTDALLALGNMYYEGIGVEASKFSGDGMYYRAAMNGNEIAIKRMRAEVTDEHEKFVLKAQLKQPDGSFKPIPYRYSGKGFAKWENGETYDGQFAGGTIAGQGKRYYSNGKLWCEGNFSQGLIFGQGIYYYTDGSVYQGTMIDGKQKGYGELTSKVGTYQGMWENGSQNGAGRLKTSDGTAYWGNYVNGKLQGEGTVIYPDGRKAKGGFSNGEMVGKWDYYNYLTGFIEVRDYTSTGVYTMFKKTDDRSELAQASRAYEEWWQKTYGRGGSQNRTPMPNNNIPQASFKPAAQSEADRHQKAMDQIYRDTEKQMKRSF